MSCKLRYSAHLIIYNKYSTLLQNIKIFFDHFYVDNSGHFLKKVTPWVLLDLNSIWCQGIIYTKIYVTDIFYMCVFL